MAHVIYSAGLQAWAAGDVVYGDDSFYAMLTTASFVPSKHVDDFRSDVTHEVVGAGYVSGGKPVAITISRDDTNSRLNIQLGGTTWPASTITARRAVYYKRRAGDAATEEVLAVVDFGYDVITDGGLFTLNPNTLRLQNQT